MSRRVLATLGVLAMTVVSTLALAPLVVPALWLPRTAICLAVTAVVILLVRTRTASAALPSAIGLLAGTLSLVPVYLGETALLGLLPTQATLQEVSEIVPATMEQLRSSFPPIANGDGVAFLVTVGVLLVYVLSEMLAVGAWAPAWSGLPLLGLWCVPVVLGAPVSLLTLGLAGLAYVLVIATQARDDAHYRRRSDARAVRATALVATVAVVAAFGLAPALLQIPSPIRIHPIYELLGSSTTRLDLGLGLRDDLLRTGDAVLFTYTGASADEVGPLHAYTVEQFDGTSWTETDGADRYESEGQMLWPTSLDGLELGPEQTIDVSVTQLGQDRLLVPGEPRSLELGEEAEYVPTADEVVVHVGSQIDYSVTFAPRILDPGQLAELEPATDVPPELLSVPQTGYESDIAALTQQIVDDAGAENPYDQLVAIQNYLRDPAEFVYSTAVAAPQTPDAVWDFLTDRHGYCVQFATAMVVMARTLGMPARLAVGFLPGESTNGVVEVHSDDAHAWPQIYFEGVGWVRFEPTPGVQAGAPPEYAPEEATSSSEPTTTATTAPSASASTSGTRTSSAVAAGEEDETDRPVGGWIALGALVLLGVGATMLARRHARPVVADLEDRWMHVLAYLERVGVDTSPSRTPRAVVRSATDVLDAESLGALQQLAQAVETASYDRASARRFDPGQVDTWVDAVVEGVRAVQQARRREPARL